MVGFVLTAGLVLSPHAAGDLQEEKRQVDAAAEDAHEDVSALNREVKAATNRVVNVRSELPAANAKLADATWARTQADGQNRQAELELEQAQGDVLAAKVQLDRIRDEIGELRQDVGEFARRAYQMGPFTQLELLLNAESPVDFTHRLEAIRLVSRSSGVALTTMSENRADLGNLRIRLVALRAGAVEKSAVAETRLRAAQQAAAAAVEAKQRVEKLVAAEQSALSTVESKRDEVKAAYDALAQEQARIQVEIAEAIRRAERRVKREAARRAAAEREAARRAAEKRARSGSSPNSGSGGNQKPNNPSGGGSRPASPSGQWLFPINGGSIGSEAGWRFHPVLRYTKCHTGADISASFGTPIRAAASGVVIMAGWSGGFGQYTTVSHGSSVTSSYAHQSTISVHNGQWVNRGQVIGYVGSTGLSTGPHLHFEARISGVPYNPRGWLGSGSKTMACP